MNMCEEIIELVGERCPDFEPGCPCCDIWEAWDLHAYGAIRADLDETWAFVAERGPQLLIMRTAPVVLSEWDAIDWACTACGGTGQILQHGEDGDWKCVMCEGTGKEVKNQ